MIRAVLEGAAYAMRQLVELIERYTGLPIRRVVTVGGAARNRLWCQIKADVWGVELIVPEVREAAVLGAALTAGGGAGLYADYREAVRRGASTSGQVIHPDLARHESYRRHYEVYSPGSTRPWLTPCAMLRWVENSPRIHRLRSGQLAELLSSPLILWRGPIPRPLPHLPSGADRLRNSRTRRRFAGAAPSPNPFPAARGEGESPSWGCWRAATPPANTPIYPFPRPHDGWGGVMGAIPPGVWPFRTATTSGRQMRRSLLYVGSQRAQGR